MRIVPFCESATKRFPEPSIAMPRGLWNRAWPPMPSVNPATPGFPAIVVTTPAEVILRIVSFPESVT